ncbi:hypothetical protein [Pseudonocardia sp.]|uniref:hypothetical protein n=1 Tax=Pseudonocardia sp. TaxID=60912 RepID=UPI003D13024F
MTNRIPGAESWRAPAGLALLLVGVFVALVVASPVLGRYWPLLLLSTIAALPFLQRERQDPRLLPLRSPAVDDGDRADLAGRDLLVGPALRASAVSLPKVAAVKGENEDAYRIDTERGHLAVADGASSSFRAAEWARMLCATFVEEEPLRRARSDSWIAQATAAFRDGTQQPSEWWSTEAAHRGAHAAFVGLGVIQGERDLVWRATAIGDCVLVHLRTAADGREPVVTAFPIAHSAAFPVNPMLLSSVADGPPPVGYIEGTAALGDVWLLMSDELARWALRGHEAGDPLWSLLSRGGEPEIAAAARTARAAGVMADDDLTVVRCELVEVDMRC